MRFGLHTCTYAVLYIYEYRNDNRLNTNIYDENETHNRIKEARTEFTVFCVYNFFFRRQYMNSVQNSLSTARVANTIHIYMYHVRSRSHLTRHTYTHTCTHIDFAYSRVRLPNDGIAQILVTKKFVQRMEALHLASSFMCYGLLYFANFETPYILRQRKTVVLFLCAHVRATAVVAIEKKWDIIPLPLLFECEQWAVPRNDTANNDNTIFFCRLQQSYCSRPFICNAVHDVYVLKIF